jgi:hypothetical protein
VLGDIKGADAKISIERAREHELDDLWVRWKAPQIAVAREQGKYEIWGPLGKGYMPDNKHMTVGPFPRAFLEFLTESGFPFSLV